MMHVMNTGDTRETTHSEDLENLHPVLKRIYEARGKISIKDITLSLQDLENFQNFHQIEKAAQFLSESIQKQESILVIGDYDADGATGTALAIRALRAMGALHVSYMIPNRFSLGYGLSVELVKEAVKLKPDILMTVDNGITSIEGVAYAKSLGLKVIITDHHLGKDTLPEADVIVNPNQQGCGFASKHLAGVGVVFYVIAATRSYLSKIKWFELMKLEPPVLAKWLDLVALGTVADVVPFDRNNRILVQQGINRIRLGLCTPGILALCKVAGRNPQAISSQDLGYVIAPRLNAAGRLDDMSIGVKCLISDDANEVEALAMRLNQLNIERRAIEKRMQQEALHLLTQEHLDSQITSNSICLYDSSWHEGVIGVIAGRLKDRYHRPSIIFADSADQLLKGSARSIAGVHIKDVLEEIANTHSDLIIKFGGHAMAAGLTLKKEKLELFREALEKALQIRMTPELKLNRIITDGELKPHECSLELAELIAKSGPWGPHFPEPCFEGHFKILGRQWLTDKHLKLNLSFPNHYYPIEAVAFNAQGWENIGDNVRIIYRLNVNEYMNLKKLQLIIEHNQPALL